MLGRFTIASFVLLAVGTVVCFTGCETVYGPNLGLVGYPIPVSPYLQHRYEEDAWNKERYQSVAILGPITSGGPAVALDPPSEDEILQALEKARPAQGGVPLLHTTQRNNIRMVIEPLGDYVDPPRVYPMIGPAQLHHAHYKCIVYFSENKWIGWPFPYKTTNEDAQEVLYIDHDHLHMVGNVTGGPGSNY